MALSTNGLNATADASKQIITLSTGIIALTVTFLKDVFGLGTAGGPTGLPWMLYAAWFCLGFAILAGLWTLLGVSGSLDAMDRKDNGYPMTPVQTAAAVAMTYGSNIRVPSLVMIGFFVAGVGLTIWTGMSLA